MTAVPDPRFRDQLEDVLVQSVGAQMPRGKVWRPGPVLDDLLPLIAAEVEARVQATANQRAAAVRRALAWAWLGHEPHTRDWDGPRSDEALEWAGEMLAHPALAAALTQPAQTRDADL